MSSYITHTLSPSSAHYYPGYSTVSTSVERQTSTAHVPPRICGAPHIVTSALYWVWTDYLHSLDSAPGKESRLLFRKEMTGAQIWRVGEHRDSYHSSGFVMKAYYLHKHTYTDAYLYALLHTLNTAQHLLLVKDQHSSRKFFCVCHYVRLISLSGGRG